MRSVRIAVLSLAVTLSLAEWLRAQPDSAPRRTTQHPAGKVSLVTNIGPAVNLNGNAGAVMDWGLMINTGGRSAIGATYSASLQAGRFEGGPTFRIRRWLGASRALDIGVGWGGEPRTDKLLKSYALFGLVEFSPKPWLGFAAQASRRGILVGAQLWSTPGLIGSILGAVVGAAGAIRPGL